MAQFREIVENILDEGGFKRMKNVLNSDDFASCLITAYKSLEGITGEERQKLVKEYDKRNEELAKIISHLGYGYKPTQGGFRYEDGVLASEPGFRVSFRPTTQKEVDIFKDEMIKLGVKFEQWSILLKLPHQKPAYIFTNEEKGVGNLDMEFNSMNDTNPKDFKYGYTQTRRDHRKHNNDKCFEYGESLDKFFEMTEEEMKTVKCKPYSCYHNTVRGIERQRLGLKGDPNKLD